MTTDIDKFKALFLLAGIEYTSHHELVNKYWPEAYVEMKRDHPWALFITTFGPVVIGWRKRVISINWVDTKVRTVVTEDEVTKDVTMVHAWSYNKALEYLTALAKESKKEQNDSNS